MKEYDDKRKWHADKVKAEVKEVRLGIRKATGKGWRLIHDGVRVIRLLEGDPFTETTTRHQIFVGTKSQCEDEINRLNLKTNRLSSKKTS